MLGGAFGSLGMVSVVPGNELYVLVAGIVVMIMGALMAWGRARAINEAKRELEGKE